MCALLLVGSGVGCSKGPSEDERAVCAALQEMIGHLQVRQGRSALESLDRLQRSAAESRNPQLVDAGKQFFTAIGQPVDTGSLTVRQSVDLGNKVLAEGGAGLAGLINECRSVGYKLSIDDDLLRA